MKDVDFDMVKVKGGTFSMGTTLDQDIDATENERPVHSVTLSDFLIGETEVTQQLWKAVMGNNPSLIKGEQLPVENISWKDCKKFIKKLNGLTSRQFRLPTEAEWEYAARGGRKTHNYRFAGTDSINTVAWYWKNSGERPMEGEESAWNWDKITANNGGTHEVALLEPNELGIFDMSGNVFEWCEDYLDYFSSEDQTNPLNCYSDSGRVYRGGAWDSRIRLCRVTSRKCIYPTYHFKTLGFRLALSAGE